MEALLSEAEPLQGLVAVARSGLVRDWDAATLRRALGWGRFAQHLHGRLRRRAAGGRDLGRLRRCPELLSLALLGNPALPPPAYRHLLRGLLRLPAGEDGDGLVPLLARRRAAAQLLGLHPAPPSPPPVEPRVPPPLRALAQLLLSRLREEEEQDGEGGEGPSPSSSAALLDRLPGSPGLSRALAAALLEPPPAAAARLVLPWLLQRGSPARLAAFCRLLPAPWLAWLCGRYPELRAPYWGLLAAWGSRLRYHPRRGEWRGGGGSGGGEGEAGEAPVSWTELRGRVGCLLEEPEPLRGETRTQLRRLRARDGDFEVRGLSVWTDLLLDLG